MDKWHLNILLLNTYVDSINSIWLYNKFVYEIYAFKWICLCIKISNLVFIHHISKSV